MYKWAVAQESKTDCKPIQTFVTCKETDNCFEAALKSFSVFQNSLKSCVTSDKNAKIYISKTQNKKTEKSILIVHGLTVSPKTMNDLALHFQRKGYNVVNMLLSGHGGTNEYLQIKGRASSWYKDIEYGYSIASALGKEVEVLGHSTGGALLVHFSLFNDHRIERLYLLDPALNVAGLAGPILKKTCDQKQKYQNVYIEDVVAQNIKKTKTFLVKYGVNVDPSEPTTTATGYCENAYWGNTKTPVSAACELLKVQNSIATISNYTEQIPQTYLYLSTDSQYNLLTKNIDIEENFKKNPIHNIAFIDNVRHGFMPSLNYNCNSNFSQILETISD